MHESSLTHNLIKKIEFVAGNNPSKVLRVQIKIGAFCPISGDHLQEHFKEAVRGTRIEDALLEIKKSADGLDPHAQEITLESVEVEVT